MCPVLFVTVIRGVGDRPEQPHDFRLFSESEIEGNGFPDSPVQIIEALSLGVTAGERRNGCDEIGVDPVGSESL